MTRTIGNATVTWLESRRICVETAARYHVYTGSKQGGDGEIEPDPKGNVIVFPYVDRGVEVAAKYRGAGKKFWQRTGGKRTFWNADVLDDPALDDGRQALVITEGELDALSVLTCGHPFAVSVPDGAPSVPAGKSPEDLEPASEEEERTGKFEFVWNNRDRLKKIKRFVIATDADAPGRRLAAELVRRLSAARCSFVTYPPDAVVPDEGGKRPCKDLNDVLMYFGPKAVTEAVANAKPYPVRGLYRLSDYPETPEIETFSAGWEGFERYLRIFPGEFMVVTGIPGHGKSTWVLNLVGNLASLHGWPIAICSPEWKTVPIMRARLRRYRIGREASKATAQEVARADAWINETISFIDIDPTDMGENDDPFDLQWIVDRATDAVLRHGIKVLVLDPWNEVEHAREKNESMSDYVARGIRMLKRFARLYSVVVIVVAHPTKEVGKDGKQRLPTLYDIENSAAWFNKADHGIVLERRSDNSTVHIQKVRLEETGRRGKVDVKFAKESGRFTTVRDEQWDQAPELTF